MSFRPRRGLGGLVVVASGLAALLLPGIGVAAPSDSSASPPGGPGACEVSGTSVVRPLRVRAGGSVEVAIRLAASCADGDTANADIFLVLDRSGSMGQDGKLEAARAAGHLFVDGVDFTRHRVGLVAFDSTAVIAQGLTDRPDRVSRALDQMDVASQGTDIAEAISLADGELDLSGRPDAVRVLILLTDGLSAEGPMLSAATGARDHGTVIFVVALGIDADRTVLARVASSRDHLAVAATPAELLGIYERIANMVERYRLTSARLVVEPAAAARYIAGSSMPAEPSNLDPLVWRVPVLGEDATEFTYRTSLTREGTYAPATSARVEFVGRDQTPRETLLAPFPAVEVLPPPEPLFLPVAIQKHCLQRSGGVDAILAVDVSDSMTGDKLADAVRASGRFVRRLDARRDRAGVVAYSSEAMVAQGLTSDFGLVDTALATLATSPGTRIDRGIEAATAEILQFRRDSATPVIVILSDGRQDVERGRALSAASVALESGVLIYSVAFGDDADYELLAALAGDPERALVARDAQALERIFTELAGLVRCH